MNTKPLTPAQSRYLTEIRSAGVKRYNGRAFKVLKALETAGLVEVDWDASMDEAKGRLRWHLTARPAAEKTMTVSEALKAHRDAGRIAWTLVEDRKKLNTWLITALLPDCSGGRNFPIKAIGADQALARASAAIAGGANFTKFIRPDGVTIWIGAQQ